VFFVRQFCSTDVSCTLPSFLSLFVLQPSKDFKNYSVLMLGRLLGGVATSLLFSVFDAWLIRSHADLKLKSYLGRSFRWAAYGNSVIAITAGLMANQAASKMKMVAVSGSFHVGGFLTPFDLALAALAVCSGYCYFTWEENYGEQPSSGSSSDGSESRSGNKSCDGLKQAFWTTIRNQEVLLCGIITALFEGSMYIFVFMWTPSLTGQSSEPLPFGLIFSTFMVCCMAGSSVFSILMDKGLSGESMAVGVFVVAATAMATIAVSPSNTVKFLGMNLFEITVGLYFPIMGTLKGTIVPEGNRAAIYNLYRIPLNFIVLFSLLTDLTPTASFRLNTAMLSLASVLQFRLMLLRRDSSGSGGSHQQLKQSSVAESGDDTERLLRGDSQRVQDKDAAV
jgi:MFS transporter, MFS domain-containing protein family, molybdate-anion transporter